MTDKLTREQRSANMRAVKGRNTGPEIAVRSAAHRLGYRFRLRSALPGKPDIVFPGRHKVIFVHGCFWHSHKGCKRATVPADNAAFWSAKLARNADRDATVLARLAADGWKALVVWECEIREAANLRKRLRSFLG